MSHLLRDAPANTAHACLSNRDSAVGGGVAVFLNDGTMGFHTVQLCIV